MHLQECTDKTMHTEIMHLQECIYTKTMALRQNIVIPRLCIYNNVQSYTKTMHTEIMHLQEHTELY